MRSHILRAGWVGGLAFAAAAIAAPAASASHGASAGTAWREAGPEHTAGPQRRDLLQPGPRS